MLYDGRPGSGTATVDTPWLEALESAIADSRLVVNAQRIVPASDDVSRRPMAQAQVLYVSDSGELVPPASFVGAAERYGVATEIDYWALDQITSFLGSRGARGAMVSLRLSARSLTDEQFAARVEGSVQRADISPRQLCLEVPEAVAIVNFNEVRDVMRRLRTVGCRFALSDFGSGLSSLAQLRALPVDFVRIDAGFSQDVEDNALQAAMVRSVTDVGHTLGKRIIAEGVNDRSRMDSLCALGVDYVQGHAIGDVLPMAQVLDARVDPREDRVIELRR